MKFTMLDKYEDPVKRLIFLAEQAEADDENVAPLYGAVSFLLEQRLDSIIFKAYSQVSEIAKSLLDGAIFQSAFTPNDILGAAGDDTKNIVMETFAIPIGFIPSEGDDRKDFEGKIPVDPQKIKDLFLENFELEPGQVVFFDSVLYHPADILTVDMSEFRLFLKSCAEMLCEDSEALILPPSLTTGDAEASLCLNEETAIPRLLIGVIVGEETEEDRVSDVLYAEEVEAGMSKFNQQLCREVSLGLKDIGLTVICTEQMFPLSIAAWESICMIRSLGIVMTLRKIYDSKDKVFDPQLKINRLDDIVDEGQPILFEVIICDGTEEVQSHRVFYYPDNESEEEFREAVQNSIAWHKQEINEVLKSSE